MSVNDADETKDDERKRKVWGSQIKYMWQPIGSRPYDCEPELDDVLIMPLKYQCKPEGGKTLDAEKKWKHWRYYS